MTQEENLFVPLCPSEDIEPGEEKVFRSNGRSVLVIRSAEGAIYMLSRIIARMPTLSYLEVGFAEDSMLVLIMVHVLSCLQENL